MSMLAWLRTAGWLFAIVLSTIPSYWFLVHPRAESWRGRRGARFRILAPLWMAIWVAVGAITWPWRHVLLYDNPLSWLAAAPFFGFSFYLYHRAWATFGLDQLIGRPEVQGDGFEQRLVTTGIHARVRHPVYLGHLCELIGWSVGTGLAVVFVLTGFAIVTGALMIRFEDNELERRFGEPYRKYRKRVPALIPRVERAFASQSLAIDGHAIKHEVNGCEVWSIDRSNVVCLAEYTNAQGPWADDYFLVFVTRGGKYYEASFYSQGRDQVIQSLGEGWETVLQLGLTKSTRFASSVIWPPQLRGSSLFVSSRRDGKSSVNPDVSALAEC